MRMSTNKRFVPLRDRQRGVSQSDLTLAEGVPEHLFPQLLEWCWRALGYYDWGYSNPEDRIRHMWLNLKLATHKGVSTAGLKAVASVEPDILLDVADWLLADGFGRAKNNKTVMKNFERSREWLDWMLYEGSSAWEVGEPPDHLTLRVPLTLKKEFASAVQSDDQIAEHLQVAWDSAWGRRSNPRDAYDGAVKALECILVPIVIPKNPMPTLGRVADALRAKPDKWDTRFRGAETVTALADMLDELWKSHGRHGGMPTNDLEQARDAVTIAVAIVALVRREFLKTVNESQPPNSRPTNSSTR